MEVERTEKFSLGGSRLSPRLKWPLNVVLKDERDLEIR